MLPYEPSSEAERKRTSAGIMEPLPPDRKSRLPLIFGSLLALIALGGIAFACYYFFLRQPAPEVSLSVVRPDPVFAGQPFTLEVDYANSSKQLLKDARLSMALPDGVVLLGAPPGKRFEDEAIGDVPSGEAGSATFNLMAVGDSLSLKHFEIKLAYRLSENSPSVFQSSTSADVSVGQSAVTLNFLTPPQVASGQGFDFTASYINNSRAPLKNLRLTLSYPANFQFQKASSTPSAGNNAWNIGDLPAGGHGEITVSGRVIGVEQSAFSVSAVLAADVAGQTYDIAKQTGTVTISTAPLSLFITANNDPAYVAKIGDRVNYTLHYKNNAGTGLQNVTLEANLTSQLFVPKSLKTDGTFNSVTNTVFWDQATVPALATLAPGAEGDVNVEVELLPEFPIRRIGDKNFTLKIQGRIHSDTVPAGVAAGETVSLASLETKVSGAADFASTVYYYDPSGVSNKGPYPPRVDKPTQFTVHWRIKNYSTDITDVHVSALLGPGVRATGVVKSPIDQKPQYNSATNEVAWDIPRIAATQGVISGSAPLEGIFQIEVTPSVNQTGQTLPLIGEAVFSAKDDFTGQGITLRAKGVSSNLPDDPRLGGDATGRVQP